MSSSSLEQKILNKITRANDDTYVIFFKRGCPYCSAALKELRKSKSKYKGYDIDKIPQIGLTGLLDIFVRNKSEIGFDSSHRTIPIVFYDGTYVGGSEELIQRLQQKL